MFYKGDISNGASKPETEEREMNNFMGPKTLDDSFIQLYIDSHGGDFPSQKVCGEWVAMNLDEKLKWCERMMFWLEMYVPWEDGYNESCLPEFAR